MMALNDKILFSNREEKCSVDRGIQASTKRSTRRLGRVVEKVVVALYFLAFAPGGLLETRSNSGCCMLNFDVDSCAST